MSIADELRALELRIAAPAPTAQRGKVAHLFADDFREIGASGRTYDKPRALATLMAAPPQEIAIENFAARELGDAHVLVTYLARTPGRVTLRSSIWARRAGGWQIVFHQGTTAA